MPLHSGALGHIFAIPNFGGHMTKDDIKTLAENALHHACSFMQDALGQKHGDIAGMFFTGEKEDEIQAIFEDYIRTEISFKELPTE